MRADTRVARATALAAGVTLLLTLTLSACDGGAPNTPSASADGVLSSYDDNVAVAPESPPHVLGGTPAAEPQVPDAPADASGASPSGGDATDNGEPTPNTHIGAPDDVASASPPPNTHIGAPDDVASPSHTPPNTHIGAPDDVAPASPSHTPTATPETPEPPSTLIVSISVTDADGAVLCEQEVDWFEGMTAYDALVTALDANDLDYKTSGSGRSVYIKSIDGRAERSQGALSGWLYKVNGETANKSCGAYTLNAGDDVSFAFSLDMTDD